jgi:hypothetical protein
VDDLRPPKREGIPPLALGWRKESPLCYIEEIDNTQCGLAVGASFTSSTFSAKD